MFVCLFWLIELLILFVLCYYVEKKNEELYQTKTFDFFCSIYFAVVSKIFKQTKSLIDNISI